MLNLSRSKRTSSRSRKGRKTPARVSRRRDRSKPAKAPEPQKPLVPHTVSVFNRLQQQQQDQDAGTPGTPGTLQAQIVQLETQIARLKPMKSKVRQYRSACNQLGLLQKRLAAVEAKQAENRAPAAQPFLQEMARSRGQAAFRKRVMHAARYRELFRASAEAGQPGPSGPADTPLLRMSRILDDYIMNIEQGAPAVRKTNEDRCEHCNSVMRLESTENVLECPTCHTTELYLEATAASMTYGEDVEYNGDSYQRVSHYRETISNFQGKTKPDIDPEVIAETIHILLAVGVTRAEDITINLVDEALRKLKRPDKRSYYKYKSQIHHILTGRPCPTLTHAEEDMSERMFYDMMPCFERHKPADRANFLSYSFVGHKLMLRIGRPELTEYFPLLKGDVKLKAQETIWQAMCEDLGWGPDPPAPDIVLYSIEVDPTTHRLVKVLQSG